MATHTVLNTPFLPGATASIYTRGGQVLPLDVPVPPGSTLVGTSPVAAGGSVTTSSVTEGQKYWAVGQDNRAAWRWISFRVDETVNPSITASPIGKLRREKTEQLVSAAGSATVGYLTLKDQGCVMDGVTNDSAAFANAVTNATTQGKELAHLGGDLRLGTAMQGRYAMRLRGSGPELSIITQADYATNHHMLDWGGYSASWTNQQNVTADAGQGTRTLVVADASGYQAGHVLILNTTQMWPWSDVADAYRGELVTVGSKAGNTLTLREPLNDSYTVAMSPYVRRSLETEDFLLEGVTLRNGAPGTHSNGFLRLRAFKDPQVIDVQTEGADYMNLLFECCNGFTVERPRFLDGNDNATAGRYPYGVAAYGATHHGRVHGLFMRGGRHAFTTGAGFGIEGIPRHITVSQGEVTGASNTCFDTHPQGEFIHFIDCHAYQTLAWGFALRCPNSDAKGCTVRENVGYAYWIRSDNASLSDCKSRWARTGTIVSTAGDPGAVYQGQGVRVSEGPTINPDECEFADVTVEDSAEDGVYIGASSDRHVFSDLIVRRPGRSGSNNNAVRLSGTTTGHRFRSPRIQNAPVGFLATSGATDVAISDPDYVSVPVEVGGAGFTPLLLGRRGTGTPEGAVIAAVGSTNHRTDGGAGSTLYVKESGTGNTGWVAK